MINYQVNVYHPKEENKTRKNRFAHIKAFMSDITVSFPLIPIQFLLFSACPEPNTMQKITCLCTVIIIVQSGLSHQSQNFNIIYIKIRVYTH